MVHIFKQFNNYGTFFSEKNNRTIIMASYKHELKQYFNMIIFLFCACAQAHHIQITEILLNKRGQNFSFFF